MIDFVPRLSSGRNAMDILSEPAGLEGPYSDRNGVNISSIAALITLSIPSIISHGNDSPLGVTSTECVIEEEDSNKCKPTLDDIVRKSVDLETTLLKPDSSRSLTIRKQNLGQITLKTSQHVQPAASDCKQESPTQTPNFGGLSKSGIIACNEQYVGSVVSGVKQNGFVSCQHDAACITSSARVCCEEEENGEMDSDGSKIPLASLETANSKDHTIRALSVKVFEPLIQEHGCNIELQLRNAENVPTILDKPYDSDISGTALEERIPYRLVFGIYRPSQGPENENIRDRNGLWHVVNAPVETDLEGDYNNCAIGSEVENFLPIPGDIMILHKVRPPFLDSYLQPNPGGNTTVFVDRAYFERDQKAREEIEYQMQRFFSENDMIIRFGKFLPGWIWKPHRQLEFFIFRGKRVDGVGKWFMHSRLPNERKLAPPDIRYNYTHVMYREAPPYPGWDCFVPRDTDIIIRPSTDEVWQPFGDDLWNFNFVDADLVLRVSIMKSQHPWRVFTADLYMMEVQVIRTGPRVKVNEVIRSSTERVSNSWIFRGRDIQMFGPPQPDPRTGVDTVLDLNGPAPFVRRPIPHWGLHEAVWGVRPPPEDLPQQKQQ